MVGDVGQGVAEVVAVGGNGLVLDAGLAVLGNDDLAFFGVRVVDPAVVAVVAVPVTVGGQDREVLPAAEQGAVAGIPGAAGVGVREILARALQRALERRAVPARGGLQALEPCVTVAAGESAALVPDGNLVGAASPDRVVAYADAGTQLPEQIGRASWRERVCQYV